MSKLYPIVLALVSSSFILSHSGFGALPIAKLSIELGQSNTSLGTSLSYGLVIGRDNYVNDDWTDGSYGIYWSKTLSLRNLKNHKISYGFMMGNPIFHIRFGTKKIVLDKNKYNGFEFQPILFTILSSNFSFYKKNESDKTLLGLGFGLGL
tara:strand:- start:196 stop:648 length:453 start_codon:yes stop_codon:yes gene_type:complete